MTKPITDNVRGHKTRYELLTATYTLEDAAKLYVGTEPGGDTRKVGFLELELIRTVLGIDGMLGASIVDIGCGIGRLTQFLIDEPIREYLGLDIIEEVLREARKTSEDDARFSFKIPQGFVIPKPNSSADLILGFASVCANLLDEEMFDYIEESFRVLSQAGVALFSYQDIDINYCLEEFVIHARATRQGHGHGDVLRWLTKDYLEKLARGAGFNRVEFIAGDAQLHHSGKPTKLMISPKSPIETFQFWQSIMVLRK